MENPAELRFACPVCGYCPASFSQQYLLLSAQLSFLKLLAFYRVQRSHSPKWLDTERVQCLPHTFRCTLSPLPSQILEIPVTARELEREHHSQLKRWKKNRGELNFKSPPRMHGTRVIMLAEPPRRQDLQQNPTILVETSQPTLLKKSKEEKKSKRSMKKPKPIEEIPNPYSLPSDNSPRPTEPAHPLPASGETAEAVPNTKSDSPHQQRAPLTDAPPAKESPLQQSTQSLSSTEQDTYL